MQSARGSSADSGRRLQPRIWDTDWLVLKDLAQALSQQAAAHVCAGMKILDFGCGSMPYRMLLEGHQAVYIGADLCDGADVRINEDGNLPLADCSVDAVLSVQVLEHVRNLDQYCGEMHRVLADDGMLLLSTHGTWLYHPHPEDHRRWTRTGLTEDLQTRGFHIEDMVAITGPLATTTLIRLTSFAFILRRIPVIGRSMAGMLAIIMNLRAIAEDWLTPEQIRSDNSCVYLVRARKQTLA
jgi:SAM-dependent methyltransferase